MNKKEIIFYFLLIGGVLCVTARRIQAPKLHKVPVYRSLVEDGQDVEDVDDVDDVTSAMTEDMSPVLSKSKVLLIKPQTNEVNEGRFFNHILLLRSLLQPSDSASRPGSFPPYLIITSPTNVNNVNNNNLTNTAPLPAAAAAAAGGGGAAGGGVRIAYVRDNEALPYAFPMPTPVFQQRRQQSMPQVIYGIPLNSDNQNQRRINRFGYDDENVYQNPNRKTNNPFSNFANRFRNVQFF